MGFHRFALVAYVCLLGMIPGAMMRGPSETDAALQSARLA